ncbi:MAG: GNAT family N-acetyltransferase [Candidatus Dormibacteraeota bacterium]|nr:GNAT family N-acetyltransferase [Candidatus Dormibacteraeota bacterium]
MPDLVVDDPRGDADLEQYVAVQMDSFAETREEVVGWLERMRPHAIWRFARSGDEVIGGYVLFPAGQFFGGRSVPVHAVAGVAVAPPWRRRGVAGILMRDLVQLSASRGAALAPLHAATTRLYRRWGWEIGDRAVRHRVRAASLAELRGDGQAFKDVPVPEIERFRRGQLHAWDGPMDRPDWWLDVEWPSDNHEHKTYGWREDGELTGFVRYREHGPEDAWIEIVVQELVAATPSALLGLLGLVGSHESAAQEIVFAHSSLRARSELLFLLPDADKTVATVGHLCWMQRIVDLEPAIRLRGWPAHTSARLELEVSDPMTPEPRRVVLEVDDGEGMVLPGGAGSVRCGIGMLASWYSGALKARDAVRMAMLEASAGDVTTMDTLVGDRETWMPDFF